MSVLALLSLCVAKQKMKKYLQINVHLYAYSMPSHIKISYPCNVSFLKNPGFQLKKCNKYN